MSDTREIAWLAGLLEGEGCFSWRGKGHNPTIQLVMTDSDVVVRAARLMGAHRVVCAKRRTLAGKPIFRMNIYGRRAAEWMMTVLPLMGARRRVQVQECLAVWKSKINAKNYPRERRPESRGAEVVWLRDAS